MKKVDTNEIFELFKEFDNTNFCELRECKLLDVDEQTNTARVRHNQKNIKVPIKMHRIRMDTLLELGDYYGIPGFLDKQGYLVDYSYLTDELLTPVSRIAEGVDVYE